ncbi:tyrosine-type recombinase/integrase [Mycobacterium camsae]|uniref:tyrosine-type recombinase/integrase n=1 Tax=Mycobacterium gordonae TaxID=1778 RepID=UPI00197EA2E4|nr:tyrosine-type recombinase/integrase [Mycobacterium gordonae]
MDGKLPGSAAPSLNSEVLLLDSEATVFRAMLSGWADQQRARLCRTATIQARASVVRRFAEFTGTYPWQWQADDADAFFSYLLSGTAPKSDSTVRGYQNALRLFCGFLTDQRYGWTSLCAERFGQTPAQILHDWNTVSHVNEFEGRSGRRPLSYDEVQELFDAADGLVDRARRHHRKGALSALRDSTLLKAVYAYGLRRQEAVGLDLVDLRSNPKVPSYGRFGGVFVRFGKATRGSSPKRRVVLTVPEMDWIVTVLACYLDEVRPCFRPGRHPALWVTERCGRLSKRAANEAFTAARDAAGLPGDLDLHSLRHSYVTHLTEFDYPERFVQDQVGHSYASTTAIYSHVSDEYRNRLLRDAFTKRGIAVRQERQ